MCQDFLIGHIFIVPYDCDFSHAPCLGKILLVVGLSTY